MINSPDKALPQGLQMKTDLSLKPATDMARQTEHKRHKIRIRAQL